MYLKAAQAMRQEAARQMRPLGSPVLARRALVRWHIRAAIDTLRATNAQLAAVYSAASARALRSWFGAARAARAARLRTLRALCRFNATTFESPDTLARAMRAAHRWRHRLAASAFDSWRDARDDPESRHLAALGRAVLRGIAASSRRALAAWRQTLPQLCAQTSRTALTHRRVRARALASWRGRACARRRARIAARVARAHSAVRAHEVVWLALRAADARLQERASSRVARAHAAVRAHEAAWRSLRGAARARAFSRGRARDMRWAQLLGGLRGWLEAVCGRAALVRAHRAVCIARGVSALRAAVGALGAAAALARSGCQLGCAARQAWRLGALGGSLQAAARARADARRRTATQHAAQSVLRLRGLALAWAAIERAAARDAAARLATAAASRARVAAPAPGTARLLQRQGMTVSAACAAEALVAASAAAGASARARALRSGLRAWLRAAAAAAAAVAASASAAVGALGGAWQQLRRSSAALRARRTPRRLGARWRRAGLAMRGLLALNSALAVGADAAARAATARRGRAARALRALRAAVAARAAAVHARGAARAAGGGLRARACLRRLRAAAAANVAARAAVDSRGRGRAALALVADRIAERGVSRALCAAWRALRVATGAHSRVRRALGAAAARAGRIKTLSAALGRICDARAAARAAASRRAACDARATADSHAASGRRARALRALERAHQRAAVSRALGRRARAMHLATPFARWVVRALRGWARSVVQLESTAALATHVTEVVNPAAASATMATPPPASRSNDARERVVDTPASLSASSPRAALAAALAEEIQRGSVFGTPPQSPPWTKRLLRVVEQR